MEQIQQAINSLKDEIDATINSFIEKGYFKEREELEKQMAEPDFWQDNNKAKEVTQKNAKLRAQTEPWNQLQSETHELIELVATKDESLTDELNTQINKLQKRHDELRRELQFNGPFDDHDAILRLSAGAGGTDAQDWTEMLLRMYTRWAEKSKMKTELLEQSAGEEAGLKSAVLTVSGVNAYGRLRSEYGVHRLVRLSPFNSDNLRQTSFALVEVLPQIDAPDEVQLDEKDLKVDVFRAGGHGGQSVNTTDSAVRITHVPTGIVVSIQNERSQLQNKETALKVLRSKLAQLQLEQHQEDLANLKGPTKSAEWGAQIRNYVLHPYKQVKDTRTKYEESDAEAVLDGKIDGFIEAYLNQA